MRKKFRLPAEAELGSMGRRREAACTCSVRNMKNTILRRWDFIYRREKNLTVYGKDSTLSLRFIGHSTCYYFTENIDDIILLFYPSNDAEHANHGGELYLKEIVIEVWGDLACFTMPYAKGERLTYPFPTPSAARGILSAIYSKPKEFRWQINRIEVLNPIRYISFKSYWLLRRTTPALRRLMILAVRRFRQAQVASMRSLWRAIIRSTQTTRSTSSTPMQMLPRR